MITTRLLAVGLVLVLGLNGADAADPEQTGSIDRSPNADLALNASPEAADPIAIEAGSSASVILPELSVTSYASALRPLPPLKPLPKWDPHVCIGC